ncbi:MAG TPA: S8 family serine peptidase [Thermoanaerobaculia bacterium]|nr:S8 family serine peptidase [Thermoanaerobaculia bacterium]
MILRTVARTLLLLASISLGAAAARGAAARATLPVEPMKTALAADGREAYVVVFREPPAVAARVREGLRAAAPSADLDAKVEAIRNRQEEFAADMSGRIGGFTAGARYARVLNGMAVLVPSGALPQLRSDPRVRAVYPVRKYALHLDASNPLMGAPAFWTALGGDGEAGRGVKIADLDTGVDFSNPMFSDPSLPMPAGFPKENDGNGFANSKVIVAKYFQGIVDASDSRLSDLQKTAQDLSGHGSHTASVAAGAKVTLSGNGRRPVTLEGVAPKAYIGDYKVFSPGAYTDNIIAAIEEATADGMNVLNMSFGLSDPNGNEPFLYSAAAENEAIQNAIAAGVTITVSAGNAGQDASGNPNPDSISSTADVPEVIAVGASTNSHSGLDSSQLARVAMTSGHTAPPANVTNIIGAQAQHTDANGNTIPPPFPTVAFSAPFADWDALDGSSDGTACVALGGAGLPLSGQVVVIQRGTCTFQTKVQNAEAAGARGVVIYNKADGSDGGDQILVAAIGPTSIPGIFIGRTDGLNLKTYVDANPGNPPSATGSFGPAPDGTPPAVFSTPSRELANFSSIGPTLDLQIKPDLTTVGTGSYAAVQDDSALGDGRFGDDEIDPSPFFDPSGFAFGQGTSFSAPRAAGSAALVRQKHPDWTPAEIKAALMETAARPTNGGDPIAIGNLSVLRRGSGNIDLEAASRVGSIVLPASYSYRRVAFNAVPNAHALDRAFTIENKTDAAVTYTLSAETTAGLSDPAIAPAVSPASLTVAAHASGTFTLSLVLHPGLLDGQNDSEGAILVSDGGASIPGTLSIPYWVRLAFPAGAPPALESATSAYTAANNQLDISLVAHDDDADLASITLDFYDDSGALLGTISDTFADLNVDTSSPDLSLDLQIPSFTGTFGCAGCASVGVSVTDAAGNVSNTIVTRFGAGVTNEAIPAASGGTYRRSIPLVAHIQGAQFPFRSDARLVNPDSSHILTIDAFYVPEGQPGAGAGTLHVAHQLLPRQSFALDDLVQQDFHLANDAGSLVLVSQDGHPFLASSRAYTADSRGGTFGTFLGSVSATGGVGAADAPAIANGIPTGAGYHTNVGVTEITGGQTTVRIEGFARDGSPVGSYTDTIPGYANFQREPGHGFSAPAARIDFTVLSGGRVLPYAATVDEKSGDTLLSVATAAPEASDDEIVPGAGRIHGAGGTFFTSDLAVSNASTAPRTLTFTLVPGAGMAPLPAPPAPVAIGAGQTLLFPDVLRTLFGFAGEGVAAIRIHPDSPTRLTASVLTSTPNASGGGSFGFFVNGTSAGAIGAGGRAVSIHLEHDARFRTNFGFTEIGGAPVTVRATFFDENGIPLGTRTYSTGANTFVMTGAAELVGAAAVPNGYIEFTVVSGAGKVIAFGTVVDNITGDSIFVPAE